MQSEQQTIDALRAEIASLKTERQRALTKLEEASAEDKLYQESQVRFRTIFETSRLGNKIIGSDLKIILVNKALMDLLGYTQQELIGRCILQFAHPDFKEDWRILQQQLWRRQSPSFSLETCLIRKDGSPVFCNVTSILFEDNGQTLGYTILEDISERRAEEDRLQKSEGMLRFIFEHIPQKIFTASPVGDVTYFNEQWENFTGLSRLELLDWGWTQFVHPEEVEDNIRLWKESMRDGSVFQIEHRFRSKTGDYCWHLTRAVPIKDLNGLVIMWAGSSTNLDEQKKAEERKDEFISIASHELKTPLTNIKAYNQIMLKKVSEADPNYPYVKKSADQINRLQHLISDLLDVTKINAGKISYNYEKFNFKDLLEDTIEGIQHTAKSHQIIIESASDVEYEGDRIRLEQVLNNFLTNAIKYSPEADKVIVRSEVDSESIIVSIQDFGIGIRPENINKLFDRYYRVDNTSTLYQGLGLGLYIASEILKRHHGTFWIESTVGQGSTFYFRLPLHKVEEETILSTRTAYKDNHIEIQYNPASGTLYADWIGFQTYESIQKGCLLMLELLTKNNCYKVLNDNSNVTGTWSEASDWVGKQWFPMMEAAGLKYFAWIYSPSKFSQLSADKSVAVMAGSVTTEFFDNKTQASDWLGQY